MADKMMPTKGPWHVLEDDETEHTVVGPDLETICQTEFWGLSELPETQSNAALIAAAGTAAHECAQMGYDPVEAVRALPDLLRQMQERASTEFGYCVEQALCDRAAGKEDADDGR